MICYLGQVYNKNREIIQVVGLPILKRVAHVEF